MSQHPKKIYVILDRDNKLFGAGETRLELARENARFYDRRSPETAPHKIALYTATNWIDVR